MFIQPWMSARDFQLFVDLEATGLIQSGLEWGGGMSTAAFAKVFKQWTTIEHQQEWIDNALKVMRPEDKHKVTFIKVEDDETKYPYPPLGNYDFVFVDGRYRGKCIDRVREEMLAPIMITHDMQRNESGSQVAIKKWPFYGKIGDDCGIAFLNPDTDAISRKLYPLLQKYDFRDLAKPSIPWHPSHEDLLWRDWCGLRATYEL